MGIGGLLLILVGGSRVELSAAGWLGGILLLACIGSGVTFGVRVRRRIARRSRALALLTMDGPHPVVSVDADGEVRHANRSALALWSSLPDADAACRQVIGAALAAAETQRDRPEIRTDVQLADRWFTVAVVALDPGQGFNLYATDITERRQARLRLQAQLARFALLNRITRAISERLELDGVLAGVVDSVVKELPADFCMVTLGPVHAAEQALRHAAHATDFAAGAALVDGDCRFAVGKEALVAAQLTGLSYHPDLASMKAPWARRLCQSGLQSATIGPLVVKDVGIGTLLVARRSLNAFDMDECLFLQQLADHVRLAARQGRLYDELRTAYADLQQSRQVVLQQERLSALGEMATGVAHDINNAISPVALYCEALLEGETALSERARRYLSVIQRAIDDVAETIARMREFSREGEAGARLQTLQLAAVVRESGQQALALRPASVHGRSAIDLQLHLQPELPAVPVATDELREALSQLIENALDAMPDGGTLTLRATRLQRDEGRGEVEVVVEDNGIGMDEATRLHCLEPFYSTKGERGAGMGLAAVYGLTRRSGMRIQIESTPGVGTQVRLFIPTSS